MSSIRASEAGFRVWSEGVVCGFGGVGGSCNSLDVVFDS